MCACVRVRGRQLTSAFQAGTRWRQRDSEMDSLHPLASPAYLAKQLLIRLRTEMRRGASVVRAGRGTPF